MMGHTNSYDVVVVGGGMAGPACAFRIAAAGRRVAVIERRSVLGWEITSSLNCNLQIDSLGETVLGHELIRQLSNRGGSIDHRLDPAVTEIALSRLLIENRIDLRLYSYPLAL